MHVTIDIDEKDFDRLCTVSMQWAGIDWQTQADRFEPETEKYDTSPRWDWKMAYWLGDSWVAVLLARAFLAAECEGCEVIFDRAGGGEYVILTDFQADSWRNTPAETAATAP